MPSPGSNLAGDVEKLRDVVLIVDVERRDAHDAGRAKRLDHSARIEARGGALEDDYVTLLLFRHGLLATHVCKFKPDDEVASFKR